MITFPTLTAHLMEQLLKFIRPDQVVFGSDSIWYGSPQWQIDAMWRFEIPEDIREEYDYPELDEEAKRKILGLNSARLYGIDTAADFNPVPEDYADRMSDELKRTLEFPGFVADNMEKFRQAYAEHGTNPANTRYGWVRKA